MSALILMFTEPSCSKSLCQPRCTEPVICTELVIWKHEAFSFIHEGVLCTQTCSHCTGRQTTHRLQSRDLHVEPIHLLLLPHLKTILCSAYLHDPISEEWKFIQEHNERKSRLLEEVHQLCTWLVWQIIICEFFTLPQGIVCVLPNQRWQWNTRTNAGHKSYMASTSIFSILHVHDLLANKPEK